MHIHTFSSNWCVDHRDILHHFPQALIRPSKDNLLIGSFSLGIAILSANPFHGTPEDRENRDLFIAHAAAIGYIFSSSSCFFALSFWLWCYACTNSSYSFYHDTYSYSFLDLRALGTLIFLFENVRERGLSFMTCLLRKGFTLTCFLFYRCQGRQICHQL